MGRSGEKLSRLVRVLLVLAITATAAFAQLSWPEKQLSALHVSFPGIPKFSMGSQSTPVGAVTTESYEFKGEGFSVAANAAKLPSAVLTFRSAEALYRDAAKALLEENEGSKQFEMSKLILFGLPAAELFFSNPTGEHGRARFVLVDETLYTIEATWKTQEAPPAISRFFAVATLR